MIDRTTKALLVAIAVGLWVQILGTWLAPTPVDAQGFLSSQSTMEEHVAAIRHEVDRVARGTCLNSRLC